MQHRLESVDMFRFWSKKITKLCWLLEKFFNLHFVGILRISFEIELTPIRAKNVPFKSRILVQTYDLNEYKTFLDSKTKKLLLFYEIIFGIFYDYCEARFSERKVNNRYSDRFKKKKKMYILHIFYFIFSLIPTIYI